MLVLEGLTDRSADATEKSQTQQVKLYNTNKANADKKVRQTYTRYNKFCEDTGIRPFPVEPLRISLFLLHVSPLESPSSSTTLIRYRTHLNRLRVQTEQHWPAERDGLSALRTPLVAAVVATGKEMVSRGPNKAKLGSDVKDDDEAESDNEVADSLQVRHASPLATRLPRVRLHARLCGYAVPVLTTRSFLLRRAAPRSQWSRLERLLA